MSAQGRSCDVSFLTHAVGTGFLAELGVDSDPGPIYFALSTVEFSVMKSIMEDDGVPLVVVGLKAIRHFPPCLTVVMVILKGGRICLGTDR